MAEFLLVIVVRRADDGSDYSQETLVRAHKVEPKIMPHPRSTLLHTVILVGFAANSIRELAWTIYYEVIYNSLKHCLLYIHYLSIQLFNSFGITTQPASDGLER